MNLLKKMKNIKNIKKDRKELDDTDYKLYMMKELSNLLPPNIYFWNEGEFEFDDWQIHIHFKR